MIRQYPYALSISPIDMNRHDPYGPTGVCLLDFFCSGVQFNLLCLLVVSWFVCFGRRCGGGLGTFRADQISMCLDPHLN